MKFNIFDFKYNPIEVDTGDEPIYPITVPPLSGDETGLIVFEDGTTQAFDASERRFIDYFDVQYVVPGNQIEKWASIKPHVGEHETKSYKRADVWRKLACSNN